MGPMLCTGKWVKKIVSCGRVFDFAVEQPQLFRKLLKNKNKNVSCERNGCTLWWIMIKIHVSCTTFIWMNCLNSTFGILRIGGIA